MTHVLDWRNAADQRDIVDLAARTLLEGRVVAFPTETVYKLAASALRPDAVERLWTAHRDSERLFLGIGSAAEAADWVPGMSVLGQRLARRCWPGPVMLVYGDGVERGLASRLPDEVRQRVMPKKALGLRVPAHEAVLRTLRMLPGPLVLTDITRNGSSPAITAADVVQAISDVDLVIEGGRSPYGQASTVVSIDGENWSLLREGAVSVEVLRQQTAFLIVFVCTGNTCRSPLAEALCKKRLAERLGCTVEELPQRGFRVLSSGLAAMTGGEASPEAIETGRALGADLSGHRSRPLTSELARQADCLVAMTQSQLLALTEQYARVGVRARLLCPEGEDIADPIGGEQQVYRDCAQQIWDHLEGLIAALPLP